MEKQPLSSEASSKITPADMGLGRGRRGGCKWFCLSCLLVIILCLGGITFVISSSGLIKIPFLTDKFYKEPLPVSLVALDKNAKENLAKKFEKLEKTTKPGQKIDLSFTEGELTYLLQSEIINKMGKKMKEFSLQSGQIAIKPDFVEFYGKIKFRFIDSVAVIHLVPKVEKEKLSVEITELKIGALPTPQFVLDGLSELINNEINKQLTQIKEMPLELVGIQLKDEELVVSGRVKKE